MVKLHVSEEASWLHDFVEDTLARFASKATKASARRGRFGVVEKDVTGKEAGHGDEVEEKQFMCAHIRRQDFEESCSRYEEEYRSGRYVVTFEGFDRPREVPFTFTSRYSIPVLLRGCTYFSVPNNVTFFLADQLLPTVTSTSCLRSSLVSSCFMEVNVACLLYIVVRCPAFSSFSPHYVDSALRWPWRLNVYPAPILSSSSFYLGRVRACLDCDNG